jgi:hypothetical protein
VYAGLIQPVLERTLSLTDVLSHSVSSMGQPEVPDERVDQFIVYGAYGEIEPPAF